MDNPFLKYVASQGGTAPPPSGANPFLKYASPAKVSGAQPPQTLNWSDVPGEMLKNLPSDASAIAGNVVGMVRHPVNTLQNVGDLAAGALRKGIRATLPEGVASYIESTDTDPTAAPRQVKMAEDVGHSLAESYGSEEGFKRQLAEHPLGTAMDASIVLGAPEAVLARVPGKAAQTASRVIGKTAEVLNPVNRAVAPIKAAARTITEGRVIKAGSNVSKVLQKTKDDLYTFAENTVGKEPVTVKEFADMARGMANEGVRKGLGGALSETTEKLYPQSKAILRDMSKILTGIARKDRPPPTYGDVEKMRQTLNTVVENSKDATTGKLSADGYLASKMIDHIDDMVDKTPYQEARKAFQTLRKTQRIERAIADAETRSSSADLAYKNEFKKIIRENNKRPLFSPAEMVAIRQVAGHGRINNLLEGLGRAGFSSKSVTAGTVATTAAATLAHLIGLDPIEAAAAVATVTSGAKAIGTRMTKARAGRARDITAQGGNPALENRLINARRSINTTAKTTANVVNAIQSAKQKSGWTPVRLKDGSTFWNPSPEEYRRLIEQGATPL